MTVTVSVASVGACGVTVTVLVASVGACGVAVMVLAASAGCDSCCVGVFAGGVAVWESVSTADADSAGTAVKIIAAEVYAMIFLMVFL